jgi:hypothetical protein
MPYSNQRRHNPPSIPQTPYQTLIIPCPNFDTIYQVILLEIPMSGITFEKLHVSKGEKKERMRFISCWERFY